MILYLLIGALQLLDISLQVLGDLLVVVNFLSLKEILQLETVGCLVLQKVGYLLELIQGLITREV